MRDRIQEGRENMRNAMAVLSMMLVFIHVLYREGEYKAAGLEVPLGVYEESFWEAVLAITAFWLVVFAARKAFRMLRS